MVIAVTKYEPSHFILMEMWRFFGKSDKMADFGSVFLLGTGIAIRGGERTCEITHENVL